MNNYSISDNFSHFSETYISDYQQQSVKERKTLRILQKNYLQTLVYIRHIL